MQPAKIWINGRMRTSVFETLMDFCCSTWSMLTVIVFSFQSHSTCDVFPFLSTLHFLPPDHSHRLLGRNRCVSFTVTIFLRGVCSFWPTRSSFKKQRHLIVFNFPPFKVMTSEQTEQKIQIVPSRMAQISRLLVLYTNISPPEAERTVSQLSFGQHGCELSTYKAVQIWCVQEVWFCGPLLNLHGSFCFWRATRLKCIS